MQLLQLSRPKFKPWSNAVSRSQKEIDSNYQHPNQNQTQHSLFKKPQIPVVAKSSQVPNKKSISSSQYFDQTKKQDQEDSSSDGPVHMSARSTGKDIHQKYPNHSTLLEEDLPFCLKNNFIEITVRKITETKYNSLKSNIRQTTEDPGISDLILNYNPKALHKIRDKTGSIIKLVIIIEDSNYIKWQKNHPMFPTKTWLQKNGSMHWLSHGITGASIITCTL